jgi:hypothetical protein
MAGVNPPDRDSVVGAIASLARSLERAMERGASDVIVEGILRQMERVQLAALSRPGPRRGRS